MGGCLDTENESLNNWEMKQAAAAVLSNKGVGTADQWERSTATRQPITRTYYICCPGAVDRSIFAVQTWLNL